MIYRVDPANMTVKWHGFIPELRFTGQYNLTGQIFALKLHGQGPFWTILGLFILICVDQR